MKTNDLQAIVPDLLDSAVTGAGLLENWLASAREALCEQGDDFALLVPAALQEKILKERNRVATSSPGKHRLRTTSS